MNTDLIVGSCSGPRDSSCINLTVPDNSTDKNSSPSGRSILLTGFFIAWAIFLSGPVLAAGELSMPVWEDVFNPDGTCKDVRGTLTGEVDGFGNPVEVGNGIPDYIDIYDALEAEFIRDIISDGIAIDMSVLQDADILSDSMLFNSTVDTAHDLGNAYFLATNDSHGDPQLYVAVERVYIAADSFIEFEFNQDRVRLGSGSPWKIQGDRTDGDLLVRLNFTTGFLSSVDVKQWQAGDFQNIDYTEVPPADGCTNLTSYLFCMGAPALDHPSEGFEVWDAGFNLVPGTNPDDFVELGIDVVGLLGAPVDFSGLLIRTPEDIAMNSFRVFGQ